MTAVRAPALPAPSNPGEVWEGASRPLPCGRSAGLAGAIESWGEVSEGGRSPPPRLKLPVLLEPPVDRAAGDPERLRRLFLVVVVDGQRAQDQLLLDLGERGHRLGGERGGDGGPRGEAGQVGERDLL